MLDTRDKTMGRFSVTVELANNYDLDLARAGHLPPDKVRRLSVRGVVDTGATRLVLPQAVVDRLGLDIADQVSVRYADGRRGERQMATGVQLTYGGRRSVFNAVVEPDRDSALIGAIVLEDLDFVVDCAGQKLVPRDPERIISEIE
jgi:clan AA aspartic protease